MQPKLSHSLSSHEKSTYSSSCASCAPADNVGDSRLEWLMYQLGAALPETATTQIMSDFLASSSVTSTISSFLDGNTSNSSPLDPYGGDDANHEVSSLFFYSGRGGGKGTTLRVTVGPPVVDCVEGCTCFYAVKTVRGAVSRSLFREQLVIGDLSPSQPLEHLVRATQTIFPSLLEREAAQHGWGDLVNQEVMDRFGTFAANAQIMWGKVQGYPRLPYPPVPSGFCSIGGGDDKESPTKAPCSTTLRVARNVPQKYRLHVLEATVVTWSKQLKSTLSMSPEDAFEQAPSCASPGPMQEIEFWSRHSADLNALFHQLQSEASRQILRFLDFHRSTYSGPFAKLCKELFLARSEASNICKYLSPLREWAEKLEDLRSASEGEGIGHLQALFRPTLHVVLLIWRHSGYYNVAGRVIVLLRKICNAIIQQARAVLNGEKIFAILDGSRPQEASVMIRGAVHVMGQFKVAYLEYKAKAARECPTNTWKFRLDAIFDRLDAFLERCHSIHDVVETVLHFRSLSRFEMGGPKGKMLTTSVSLIYSDFEAEVDMWRLFDGDVMDLNASEYETRIHEFKQKIKSLEGRIGSVLCKGFDDCSTSLGKIRMLDGFSGLSHRPPIALVLEQRHLSLLEDAYEDILDMTKLFSSGKRDPPQVNLNFPPVSGALLWSRGVKDRLNLLVERLRHLDDAIMARDEAMDVVKSYTLLAGQIADFERGHVDAFLKEIQVHLADLSLRMELLTRTGPGTLCVNFDPNLIRLLRELKYFVLLRIDVPPFAMDFFHRADSFRRHKGNLELMVHMYNEMHARMLPVEVPLLSSSLRKLDRQLEAGVTASAEAADPDSSQHRLSWRSPGIDTFVNESLSAVRVVNGVLTAVKMNLVQIQGVIHSWSTAPMFRREAQACTLTAFCEAQKGLVRERKGVIGEGSSKIRSILKETNGLLKVSQALPEWRNYTDYINSLVVEGLCRTVAVSLQTLESNLNPDFLIKQGLPPLIEIELHLVHGEVVLKPDVGSAPLKLDAASAVLSEHPLIGPEIFTIRGAIRDWIDEILGACGAFQRLDVPEGTFLKEIEEDPHVRSLLAAIDRRFDALAFKGSALKCQFEAFKYLWTTDLSTVLSEFQRNAMYVDKLYEGEIPDSERMLDLAQYDERLRSCLHVQAEVGALQSVHELNEVIRVNGQPAKQAINTWSTKWLFAFSSSLQGHVVSSLTRMSAFIKSISAGLDTGATALQGMSPSTEKILSVIGHIRDVRKRAPEVTSVIGPLRETVQLLQARGVQGGLSTSLVGFLEEAPAVWNSIVNKAYKLKCDIAPLEAKIADEVRSDVVAFADSVKAYQDGEFRQEAPYTWAEPAEYNYGVAAVCGRESYLKLDHLHAKLADLSGCAKALEALEELLDIAPTRFKALDDMKMDISLLKTVWDMVGFVESLFCSWMGILWSERSAIDRLGDDMSDLLEQIQLLPRRARGWDVYQDVEKRVKSMALSLPLAQLLNRPSMRERHWQRLLDFIGAPTGSLDTMMSPSLCLKDVLRLRLELHPELVKETAEAADRELLIEEQIASISRHWGESAMTFEDHQRIKASIVVLPNLIERELEDHQMRLQIILDSSKHVDFFKPTVMEWRDLLGDTEAVLRLFLGLQARWISLEAIFLSSLNIRSQLEQESRCFEQVDQTFKAILVDIKADPRVLSACSRLIMRGDELNLMLQDMDICEQALGGYLDSKRLAFPRFAFLSNASLLEIVSKSNFPFAVQPYLCAMFGGISSLEVRQKMDRRLESGSVAPSVAPSVVTAMISHDCETTPLSEPVSLGSPAEVWLQDLVITMHTTLRQQLASILSDGAMPSGLEEGDAMIEWLAKWPGQILSLSTQLLATSSTHQALERLERGEKDALRSLSDMCHSRVEALLLVVRSSLAPADGRKAVSLLTEEIHMRDVIARLVDGGVTSTLDFLWQSQLRLVFQVGQSESSVSQHSDLSPEASVVSDVASSITSAAPCNVTIRICNYSTGYGFEYLGSCCRLVITPLTERCYVSLTNALFLNVGGALVGPPGTGKTETIKDLARAMGLPCYVLNCSGGMSISVLGQILRGLVQSGAWGCFDEFHQLSADIISPLICQIESIQAAQARLSFSIADDVTPPDGATFSEWKIGLFDFMGGQVALVPTYGLFVAMRQTTAASCFPLQLSAIFRSCAVSQPDLEPVCEGMLLVEGFSQAALLARKLVTLFHLSKQTHLSHQIHFDWGLRALKHVIKVAGEMRRERQSCEEEIIIFRALHIYGKSSLLAQDRGDFRDFVSDLFLSEEMSFHPSPNESMISLGDALRDADLHLQPDEALSEQVAHLEALMGHQPSVILVGEAGCGKSSIWRSLVASHNYGRAQSRTVVEPLNPKVLTVNELYGHLSRELVWSDGSLTAIMRSMSRSLPPYHNHDSKWIVLDGDMDGSWTDMLLTVMNQDGALTLGQDSISLSPSMRLLFEVHSLQNASPASVSRAGIHCVVEGEKGWFLPCQSWMQIHSENTYLPLLTHLFQRHIPSLMRMAEQVKLKSLEPVGLSPTGSICGLLDLLSVLLSRSEFGNSLALSHHTDLKDEKVERIFLWAALWAFGGAFDRPGRQVFSDLWRTSMPHQPLELPDDGLIFDYRLEPSGCLVPWIDHLCIGNALGGSPADGGSFISVPTTQSAQLLYMMTAINEGGKHLMAVGRAGGKTSIAQDFIRNGRGVDYSTRICVSYFSTAATLQARLEYSLEKCGGKIYAPPMGRRHIYFIDDLNMSNPDEYGTQSPVELLRQWMDYGSWFDKKEPGLRKIVQGVNFLVCSNPTRGTPIINPRLQRRFFTLASVSPCDSDLQIIFESVLSGHLSANRFPLPLQHVASSVVTASIGLFRAASRKFPTSALNCHYLFSLHELSMIICGLCRSHPSRHGTCDEIISIWAHECRRVFGDRLVSDADREIFKDILSEVTKKHLTDYDSSVLEDDIYAHFLMRGADDIDSGTTGDQLFLPKRSVSVVSGLLTEIVARQTINLPADLRLFDDAIRHVCRIARVLGQSQGHILLLGAAGLGKRTLTKVATVACNFRYMEISTEKDALEKFKCALRQSGAAPGRPTVLILTESALSSERLLVAVNDIMLGERAADLAVFSPGELDLLLAVLRAPAGDAGVPDNRASLLEFFSDRVRENLHIVLATPQVGTIVHRFPSLANYCSVNWLHPWPRDALVGMALDAFKDLGAKPFLVESLAYHAAEAHALADEVSTRYRTETKRSHFSTPKTFLEFIARYRDMLGKERSKILEEYERVGMGMKLVNSTVAEADSLRISLREKLEEISAQAAQTEGLLVKLARQRCETRASQEATSDIQAKVESNARDVASLRKAIEKGIAEMKPAMEVAANAVASLNKDNIAEIKAHSAPPDGVHAVTKAILAIAFQETSDFSWNAAKKMMARVEPFKSLLGSFQVESISPEIIARVDPIVKDPEFDFDRLQAKSIAAAHLCRWATSTIAVYRMHTKTKPLRERLAQALQAEESLVEDSARLQLNYQRSSERLDHLHEAFMKATEEKNRLTAENQEVEDRLLSAKRIGASLGSEVERWKLRLDCLSDSLGSVHGDVMLAAAFVSYAGALTSAYRQRLWRSLWRADLSGREVSLAADEGWSPLSILASPSQRAQWERDGLPRDDTSAESGAILAHSTKMCTLFIDPEGQALGWLKVYLENHAECTSSLLCISQNGSNWLEKLSQAMETGSRVLLEGCVGPLSPVHLSILQLQTALITRPQQHSIRLLSREVEVCSSFRLYVQVIESNPVLPADIFVSCTVINFSLTQAALENILLDHTIFVDQPDAYRESCSLLAAGLEHRLQLECLENKFLAALASTPVDALADSSFIEELEVIKQGIRDANDAIYIVDEAQRALSERKDSYGPVAADAAHLYCMLQSHVEVDHMQQYSLYHFLLFLDKALGKSIPPSPIGGVAEGGADRCDYLRRTLRLSVYRWAARGLFRSDRLPFLSHLVMGFVSKGTVGEHCGFSPEGLSLLLSKESPVVTAGQDSPLLEILPWLGNKRWASVLALARIPGFEKFPGDITQNSRRFKEWCESSSPELESLPLEYRELDHQPFRKLLAVHALRPDRMIKAMPDFIRAVLPDANDFLDEEGITGYGALSSAFEDCGPDTPLLIIHSSGAAVDVTSYVDRLADESCMAPGVKYFRMSVGEGQESLIMAKLQAAEAAGHWLLLENVHAVPGWLQILDDRIASIATRGCNSEMRLILIGDQSSDVPLSFLRRSFRLAYDPPTRMKALVIQSLDEVNCEAFDASDSRMRALLYGVAHFHAMMLGRAQYGWHGFNGGYSFSKSDIKSSLSLLTGHAAGTQQLAQWCDIRAVMESVYQGNMSDASDRLVCHAYLEFVMGDQLLDEVVLVPGHVEQVVSLEGADGQATHDSPYCAPSTARNYKQVLAHVALTLKDESPELLGLPTGGDIIPDALRSANLVNKILQSHQGRVSGSSVQSTAAVEQLASDILDQTSPALPQVAHADFAIDGEPLPPLTRVLVKELRQMSSLLLTMTLSLSTLCRALRGDHSMSGDSQQLSLSLAAGQVPQVWRRCSSASLRPLPLWLSSLQDRITQLCHWKQTPLEPPTVTWLGGLFNPHAFLAAIKQVKARSRGRFDLSSLRIVTEVTKKLDADEVSAPCRDGVFISGMSLEGATWSSKLERIEKAGPRELACIMPIICVRAEVAPEERGGPEVYMCPVYETQARGSAALIFHATLKTRAPPSTWIMAGAALLADRSADSL